MADRTVAIRLTLNPQGLVAGFKQAQTAAGDFASKGLDKIAKNEQSITQLSNTVGALGLAMVGAAGLAVKSFADFDAAMSNVEALGGDAAASMDELRAAAIQAGRDTAFSAQEAALGVTELMKAGVSAADVLDGGLTGALDLAAAGELAVAEAATIAATTMTQFGLEGRDVTRVADSFASAANNAQGSVQDVALAMSYAGIPAAALGLEMEETTGVLGLFANAGITGEKAGTAFRGMLVQMQRPSGEAARLMEELNVEFFDAQGNFIGMESVAGQLQERLGGLTQEQRGAALATIFGSEALGAATALYNGGEQAVADWTETVTASGYAAEVAATKLDNLKGDLQILRGSLETAMIGLGEGADGPLRNLVQRATEAVNSFSELPAGVQNATLALVGGGGLVLLGVAGLGKLAVAVNQTVTSLRAMGVISSATAGKMNGLAAGLARVGGVAVGVAATAAATGLLVEALTRGDESLGANALAAAIQDVVEAGGDLSRIDAAFQNTGTVLGLARTEAGSLTEVFDQMLNPSTTDRISGFFDGLPGVTGYMEILEERAGQVDQALSGMVAAGDVKGVLEFQTALEDAGYSAEEINRLLPQTADALIGAKDAAGDTAEVQARLADEYRITADAVDEQVDSLEDLISAQAEAAGVVMSAMEAESAFQKAIDDATQSVKDNGASLDLTTEKGRNNQAALLDISEAGYDVIASMEKNGATQDVLQEKMARTRERFLKAAEAMGLGADEASALADELGLIPANVTTDVNVKTRGAHEQIAALKAKYNGMTLGEMYLDIKTRNKFTPGQAADAARYTAQATRASGGPVTGGRTYLVGENGPELFTAPATGMVTNTAQSRTEAMRYVPSGISSSGGATPAAAGVSAADIASAFNGMSMTLMTEAGPIRAIARAEVRAGQRAQVAPTRAGVR